MTTKPTPKPAVQINFTGNPYYPERGETLRCAPRAHARESYLEQIPLAAVLQAALVLQRLESAPTQHCAVGVQVPSKTAVQS